MDKNLTKEQATENLLHYGVVGMKWGKRRAYNREIRSATNANFNAARAASKAMKASKKGDDAKAQSYAHISNSLQKATQQHIDNAARLGVSTHTKRNNATKVLLATLVGSPIVGLAVAGDLRNVNPMAKAANERRKAKGYK